MKVVIIQPSFLPWRGYFHLIQRSDIFVFYDDVQYDKHSWRNRNQIKTPNGPQWITVPVLTKNKFGQKINEIEINNSNKGWQRKILGSIFLNYKKAKFYDRYIPVVDNILSKEWPSLCALDVYATKKICEILGIKAQFFISSELNVSGDKISRLINICKKLGGTHYISGPSAKNYLKDTEEFTKNGIKLEFHDYNYPEYTQLYGKFEPAVSIIDLIFNCGDESPEYIWGNKLCAAPEIKPRAACEG